jgi:hypothetical protein
MHDSPPMVGWFRYGSLADTMVPLSGVTRVLNGLNGLKVGSYVS